MAGSIYGTLFRVSTWGESHGKGIGVVIDGCPAGLPLDEEDIQRYLDRRKPGQSRFTTARQEGDQVEILSGVFEGKTTGTPIALEVRNTDQRSHDYSNIMDVYRPGHADFTFDQKYGFRDYRGGGRSSGRETIGRVAAGAVAAKLLERLGVRVFAYTSAIGPVSIDRSRMEISKMWENRLYMPDDIAAKEAESYLEDMMARRDSCGGVVECVIEGLPAGVGEPVFDKLDAALAKAMMSIGAVKGVEIGDGFEVVGSRGSLNADRMGTQYENGFASNHAGGILGGISTGAPITARVAIKPTPSIRQEMSTLTVDGKDTIVSTKGRHDPCVGIRATPILEALTALVLIDQVMAQRGQCGRI